MTTLEVIGANLLKFRREWGYTQEALANELNMSACNIRKIEHGKGNPRIQTLDKLARHFKIRIVDFFVNSHIAQGTK